MLLASLFQYHYLVSSWLCLLHLAIYHTPQLGYLTHIIMFIFRRERMKLTLDLLLRRGADPNASRIPMPVLFFAIKAADVEMVKMLLLKGASTSITLQKEVGV